MTPVIDPKVRPLRRASGQGRKAGNQKPEPGVCSRCESHASPRGSNNAGTSRPATHTTKNNRPRQLGTKGSPSRRRRSSASSTARLMKRNGRPIT